MLSLRMIIAAGVAGIALWGLFELVDNLKEPGLMRTQNRVVVKGCDRLDAHPDAPRLCPQFLCQKALIDRKLTDAGTQLKFTVDERHEHERLIGGQVPGTDRSFLCTTRQLKVLNAELLSAAQLEDRLPGMESDSP